MKNAIYQADRQLDALLGYYDLNVTQAFLLFRIMDMEQETSVTQLHHEYEYSKGTISENIKKLVKKGLVRKEYCEEDERRKKISLTQDAQKMLETIERDFEYLDVQLPMFMTKEESEAIVRVNRKMMDFIEKGGNRNGEYD